jgi:hypothetical protein
MSRTAMLDSNEIRELAASALASLDHQADVDWENREAMRAADLRCAEAKAALRLCAAAAALNGDRGFLPDLERWADALEGYQDDNVSARDDVLEAVKEMLADGAAVTVEVRRMARSRRSDMRRAVAQGLKPRVEGARELLEALSQDSDPYARQAAREKLATLGEVPWWYGKFRSDPLLRLSDEDGVRLRPTLMGIAEWMDLATYARKGREHVLVEHVCKLPDALALEVAEQFLSSWTERYAEQAAEIARHVAARERGTELVWRLVEAASAGEDHRITAAHSIERLFQDADADLRERVGRELLARAAATTGSLEARVTAARIVASLWPDECDPTPVLDAFVALPKGDPASDDFRRMYLGQCLERETLDLGPVTDRLVEAFKDGCPGPYARLRGVVERAVGSLDPAIQRRLASEALAGDDEQRRTWALCRLCGPLYDEAIDGERWEFAGKLMSDERNRALLVKAETRQRLVPLLREQLVADLLTLEEASMTMLAIGEIHGGVKDVRGYFAKPEDAAERRRKAREAQADWIEAGQGPPTAAEWAAFRRLSRRAIEDDASNPETLLVCIPEGPWQAADRELLDALVRRFDAARDEKAIGSLAWRIGSVMLGNPIEEDLPRLVSVAERDRRASPTTGSVLDMLLERFRDALGLQPDDVKAVTTTTTEWMDEPEDEEW